MIRGALPVGLALFLAHAVRQIFWNSSRLGERSPQPKRIPRNQKPHQERKTHQNTLYELRQVQTLLRIHPKLQAAFGLRDFFLNGI